MTSVAVILGSAFAAENLPELELDEHTFDTEWGSAVLHRTSRRDRPAWVLFRHGLPHRWLPNQIPYRAHAAALAAVDCSALLVTSSVGVLGAHVPLNVPMLVSDLLTLDNRLPDGTACTMFMAPSAAHGHLVLEEGMLSCELGDQLRRIATECGIGLGPEVVFGYVGGPRLKTAAENRMWAQLGADVNSMTLAPEIILANELRIACAGLVVGHKYSLADHATPDRRTVSASLEEAKVAQRELVVQFLAHGKPVEWSNSLYRFSGDSR